MSIIRFMRARTSDRTARGTRIVLDNYIHTHARSERNGTERERTRVRPRKERGEFCDLVQTIHTRGHTHFAIISRAVRARVCCAWCAVLCGCDLMMRSVLRTRSHARHTLDVDL